MVQSIGIEWNTKPKQIFQFAQTTWNYKFDNAWVSDCLVNVEMFDFVPNDNEKLPGTSSNCRLTTSKENRRKKRRNSSRKEIK